MNMKFPNPEIFITEDGSSSLFLKSINESYHSKYGAISESRHVFINAGLKSLSISGRINILEIGFGTGLNALLTLHNCLQEKIAVFYHSVEPYPLPISIFGKLNYAEVMENKAYNDVFILLHEPLWDTELIINEYFILKKWHKKLEDLTITNDYYNLIYFDAFSPDVQPELWTTETFKKIFKSMCMKSVLVTYSAKGVVRRNLMKAGFNVERLPGPKGKREMMRATKL
jgi:tRNA U34 5-methylaminomethyl-2-thiouridine-forming methyltransferase MnmC